MTEIEIAKAESFKTIITGIISKNMGYANQSLIVKSAEAVTEYIGRLNQTEFRTLKKFLNSENKIDRQDSSHDRYTVLESETVGSGETLTDEHSENLDREPLESKTDDGNLECVWCGSLDVTDRGDHDECHECGYKYY